MWDPLFKVLNKTRLYEIAMKRMSTYVSFSIFLGLTSYFVVGRLFDRFFCWVNKGHMYQDNLYVYPPEEDEED